MGPGATEVCTAMGPGATEVPSPASPSSKSAWSKAHGAKETADPAVPSGVDDMARQTSTGSPPASPPGTSSGKELVKQALGKSAFAEEDDQMKADVRKMFEEDAQAEEEADESLPLIERTYPTIIFTAAIVINSVFIGVDTDVRSYEGNDVARRLTFFADLLFFCVFTVELVLRLYADKCPRFLFSRWNVLDTFLVAANFLEVFAALSDQSSGLGSVRALKALKMSRSIRVLRIFRVFRFKRVLRAVRGLIVLIYAIAYSAYALVWVGLVFIVAAFMFGIITAEFLGLMNDNEDPIIQEYFGDLLSAMFTACHLTTFDGWSFITRHVSNEYGLYWQFFFVSYVFMTKLFLLNVVLAVLVERIFTLKADLQDAQAGTLPADEMMSWMKTPSSLASEPPGEELVGVEEEVEEDEIEQNHLLGEAADEEETRMLMSLPGTPAGRLQMEYIGVLFELCSTKVSRASHAGRSIREVTKKTFLAAQSMPEVQLIIDQGVPSWRTVDVDTLGKKLWMMHPLFTPDHPEPGFVRADFMRLCFALSRQLAAEAFMKITERIAALERCVMNDFVHLNKHQRRINRRFLKLRHRLRKIYHFDNKPKAIIGAVKEEHIKRNEERTIRQQKIEDEKNARKQKQVEEAQRVKQEEKERKAQEKALAAARAKPALKEASEDVM